MKTRDVAKSKAALSSPHKPGAMALMLPSDWLPPAKVSADQRDSDTHRRAVSHEPGQSPAATQIVDAGLESFASDGEGGGQAHVDNQKRGAAPEDCHDDGQVNSAIHVVRAEVVTGGGSDAPSDSLHGEGHAVVDTQKLPADAVDGGGQPATDTQQGRAPSESLTGHLGAATQSWPAGLDQGQRARDTQNQAALIQNITARYRLRIFYREAADAVAKRLFGYCYQLTAPDYDHTKPGQKAKHAAAATKLVKQTFAGDPPIELVALRCDLLLDHHKAMKQQQAEQEKAINKRVKGLPAWAWVEQFKGLGPGGFGEIVAHCGDLSKYSNPAKVWKRMGLGLVQQPDGCWVRQRRCKDKDAAALHAYSPRRRAVMYSLGESLLRARRVNPEMGELYDKHKAGKMALGWTKFHAHNHALRIIEKRLLRDLWRAWRAESGQLSYDTQESPAASAAELEEAA